jgi:hypothetical protein
MARSSRRLVVDEQCFAAASTSSASRRRRRARHEDVEFVERLYARDLRQEPPSGHGAGMEFPRVLTFLAVVFTVAAAGSLALVVLDLVIDRPAAGDVFVAVLNALAAFVLWRRALAQTRA